MKSPQSLCFSKGLVVFLEYTLRSLQTFSYFLVLKKFNNCPCKGRHLDLWNRKEKLEIAPEEMWPTHL